MYTLVILCLLSYFTFGLSQKDVEEILAETNAKGFPSSLLYEAASISQNKVESVDKETLIKLLESDEVQVKARKSALEYSAQILNRTGMQRALLRDESLCEYSWISWLPWFSCPEQDFETKQTASTVSLIKEQGSKCYKKTLK